MKLGETEKFLKVILGSEYGGPSLGFDSDKGEFIIYRWCDKSGDNVGVLARGYSLEKVIDNYLERKQ